jgi:hypothetical protein
MGSVTTRKKLIFTCLAAKNVLNFDEVNASDRNLIIFRQIRLTYSKGYRVLKTENTRGQNLMHAFFALRAREKKRQFSFFYFLCPIKLETRIQAEKQGS